MRRVDARTSRTIPPTIARAAGAGGDDAGLRIEHETPHERRDDRRNGPREESGETDEGAAADGGVHQQRERKPERQLQRNRDHGKHDGTDQRGGESRILRCLREIGKPDERPSQPRQPEVVSMKRFPARRRDGYERTGEDEHQRRCDEPARQAPLLALDRGQTRDRRHRSSAFVPASSPERARSARISRAASRRAAAGGCCPLSARWRRTCRISESSL